MRSSGGQAHPFGCGSTLCKLTAPRKREEQRALRGTLQRRVPAQRDVHHKQRHVLIARGIRDHRERAQRRLRKQRPRRAAGDRKSFVRAAGQCKEGGTVTRVCCRSRLCRQRRRQLRRRRLDVTIRARFRARLGVRQQAGGGAPVAERSVRAQCEQRRVEGRVATQGVKELQEGGGLGGVRAQYGDRGDRGGLRGAAVQRLQQQLPRCVEALLRAPVARERSATCSRAL